jgi:protein-disulfide isomerase
MRSQAKIRISLEPPAVARLTVSTDGAPFRGAADAPVTIVEFSDFHCPFCKSALPTLTQLLQRYPGKLRLVHRDFPVDNLQPAARRAAEAARCAHDRKSSGTITICSSVTRRRPQPRI